MVSSITDNSVTLNWRNGHSEVELQETGWQISYSTNPDFTPGSEGTIIDINTNPYTLSGLTEGATYYAYIRSIYSGTPSLRWSNIVAFTPKASIVANDDDYSNANVPLHNNTRYSGGVKSQMVIPSGVFTDLSGRSIGSIIFYATTNSIDWTGATFNVYIDEPETYTTYSSSAYKDYGTQCCTAKPFTVSNGELEIELDTPFSYAGGSLTITIEQVSDKKTSSNVSSTWYGVSENTNYTSIYSYKSSESGSYSDNRVKFSPKIQLIALPSSTISATIGTNGYTTFASPRPLDLTDENIPTGLTAYKAAVDGTTVRFTKINQTVEANTGVLLEGTASQTYNIPVADSGTAVDGNEFLVNTTGGTFTADDGYTYYGMIKATESTAPLVFGTFAPGTVAIPTNKAYLKVANAGEARQLSCVFEEGTTTSISEEFRVKSEEFASARFYNLQGQRVSKPAKGLYIVGGKKVSVK